MLTGFRLIRLCSWQWHITITFATKFSLSTLTHLIGFHGHSVEFHGYIYGLKAMLDFESIIFLNIA